VAYMAGVPARWKPGLSPLRRGWQAPESCVQERIGLQAVHRLRSAIVERARDRGGLRAGHRNHVPDLYSANVSYPGMNLQIAATLDRALITVGPRPVHGAGHDAHGSPR
jgi:hypothetical protein